jgi:hypothetical protein
MALRIQRKMGNDLQNRPPRKQRIIGKLIRRKGIDRLKQ